MKPIVIRRFCRPSLPFLLLFLIFTSCFLWFMITGIAEQNTSMTIIGILFLFIPFIGFGLFCLYGIKITKNHVIVLYYNTIRVFRYEDITRIEIGFDIVSIWGEIKAKDEPVYSFYFDDFELDPASWLSRFWSMHIHLPPSYIKKIQTKLSTCNKVRIINRYKPKS